MTPALRPVLLGLAVAVGSIMPAFGERAPSPTPSDAAQSWFLEVGEARHIEFDADVSIVAIGDQDVLNATMISPRGMILTALTAGRTNMVVIDAKNDPIVQVSIRTGRAGDTRVVLSRNGVAQTLVCQSGQGCDEIEAAVVTDVPEEDVAPEPTLAE